MSKAVRVTSNFRFERDEFGAPQWTIQAQNKSGGALAKGDVVVWDAANSSKSIIAVKTTTSANDPTVVGMALETIAANGVGRVLIWGPTDALKVNGATAIAKGDMIGAYTTVKIGQKTTAVGAFATAMEAYAVGDSAGVIDAFIHSFLYALATAVAAHTHADGANGGQVTVAAFSDITAIAAEINLLDGSQAGVAIASKLACLGASKNLDILGLPVGGLKIGAAGAEVAVTPSAAELNTLTGVTATAAEINKAADQDAKAVDGLLPFGVARFTFDPTATAGSRTQAAHGTGVTLPANAIVVGGFFEVNTAFTSTNSTATVAISVEGANDIQTAAAVSGAPYSTIGRKAIVPKADTPESSAVKATAAREITCTVGVEALLGGKLTGFLYYVVSAASA